MGGILSLLQPPLDGALAAMAICIAAAYYFLVAHHRLALLPGIPVAPNNSYLFGWTTFSSSSFEILRLMDRLGPMVQGRALNRNVLSIRDPTLAKKVLKDVKGKGFFHNPAPKLIRQSTFSLDTGPEWHQRRSCFRAAFSTSSLRMHLPNIARLVEKLCGALETHAAAGSTVCIDELFAQLTIGVICETAFDMDMSAFDGTDNECSFYGHTLREVFKYGWISMIPFSFLLYHLPVPPFTAYKTARTHYLNLRVRILQHIRRLGSENKIRKGSLAESILTFSELPGIVEDDVLSEIGLFFVAGMDTTAHTLAFAIYAMARNPSVQSKAHAEVDGLVEVEQSPDAASLPPYLEAVLKESMRKYPTASTGSMRQVNMPEGYDLTPDIHLPKGWWINIQCFALHNSKFAWGGEADDFIPERWLPSGDASAGAGNPLASQAAYAGVGMSSSELCFFPFGYGMRNCVGMNLALIELRVALLSIVKKFKFELADESLKDEEKALVVAFTMHPADMLPVKVYTRG